MLAEHHKHEIVRALLRGEYTEGQGIRDGKSFTSVRIEIPSNGWDLCEVHQLPLAYLENEGVRKCTQCLLDEEQDYAA